MASIVSPRQELHDQAEPARRAARRSARGRRWDAVTCARARPSSQQALRQLAVAVTAMQDLDRHRHLEHGIPGAIDAAEPAAADLLRRAGSGPTPPACRRAGGSYRQRRASSVVAEARRSATWCARRRSRRASAGAQLRAGPRRTTRGHCSSSISAAQSTGSRSATSLPHALEQREPSDMARLFGQPLDGAVHGHARRARRRLAEIAREVLVVVRELEARRRWSRDRHAVEPLQRRFVASQALGADQPVERRRVVCGQRVARRRSRTALRSAGASASAISLAIACRR